jgi:hypothetical protein
VRIGTVRDRRGREIYITEERWKHIVEGHEELSEHLADVLDTVRKGHPKQDAILPYKYTYTLCCEDLPGDFDRIVVKVIFRPEGNNFIVTAWPDYW